MRDYTSNNYCDFLWIDDLLELKRDSNKKFFLESQGDHKSIKFNISLVTVFGTIVEIKQVGFKEFLYRVDDGTGVITCKHTEEQFESIISSIENEHLDILNQTLEHKRVWEQSAEIDTSADDSIFNDKSMQMEEININKESRLKGLQSIWDDIYKSFNCLLGPYSIGDSVIIQGKLYNYFNENQIYVNSIRSIDLPEEILMLKIKLEDSFKKKQIETETVKMQTDTEKRASGLMTFDNIPSLNANIIIPRSIEMPQSNGDVLNFTPEIVTPNLQPTITYDTFTDVNEDQVFSEKNSDDAGYTNT